MDLKQLTIESTNYIQDRTNRHCEIGLILGTGLGSLADDIKDPQIFLYSDIPHFPESTVKFHAGRLVIGELSGKNVIAMQGRFHHYEGHSMQSITLPVRVMHQLGIRLLVTINAAGGICEHLTAGTIGLINDHINLMGDNPLIGPYDPFYGERFPDMSEPYSKRLMKIAHDVAAEQGITLKDHIYAAVAGPSFETGAEIHMLQMLGADSVGMSVVPEVLVARQLDIEILAFSIITDQALPEKMMPVSHDEVKKVAMEFSPKLLHLIKNIFQKI